MLDGKTGKLWCGVDPTGVMCEGNDALRTQPIAIEGGNLGGPATIADFDGDGRPEAGIAGGVGLRRLRLQPHGREIVVPRRRPDAGRRRDVRPLVDSRRRTTPRPRPAPPCSTSRATAPPRSPTRTSATSTSTTARPATRSLQSDRTPAARCTSIRSVVDADGDGNAEFLVVANLSEDDRQRQLRRAAPRATSAAPGRVLLRRRRDNWVPDPQAVDAAHLSRHQRRLNGNVPLMEQANWTVPGLNNFRQNVQGECK